MNKIGLYIHVPFCLSRCRYCDFYSIPADNRVPEFARDVSSYMEALFGEMKLYEALLEERRDGLPGLHSIYLGGGTPTVLGGEALAEIIGFCRSAFRANHTDGIEITMEVNPDTVHPADLRRLHTAGVNRVSLGVQTFNPDTLKVLGRRHTCAQALNAYDWIREAGFDNVSLDLMLGLPGQTLRRLRHDLETVVRLSPEHVSAYLLKLEEETPFYTDFKEGRLELPGEDAAAAIYRSAIGALKEAGYRQYEISNLARPGFKSRHNLIYWENGEYLGLGPAAHSALREGGGMVRRANSADLYEYVRRVRCGELPLAAVERVSREWEMAETMFLGLRRMAGVKYEEFQRRFGQTIDEAFPGAIDVLATSGLLAREETGVRLTEDGILLSNEVFLAFLPQ